MNVVLSKNAQNLADKGEMMRVNKINYNHKRNDTMRLMHDSFIEVLEE